MISFAKIREAGALVTDLAVSPMDRATVQQLVADTMRVKSEDASELADEVMRKTRGNPFFIKTFLHFLYEKELLNYGFDVGHWTWNIQRIREQKITDNVVDLLLGKMQDLYIMTWPGGLPSVKTRSPGWSWLAS